MSGKSNANRPVGLVMTNGGGELGQLGLGEDTWERKKPTPLNELKDKEIIDVAAGGVHTMALSKSGKLYSWGCNDQAALGRKGDAYVPGAVEGLDEEEVVQVALGDSVSTALTAKGDVYSWGTFRSADGIMGFSEEVFVQERPVKINVDKKRVKSIASGSNHVLALTEDGHVYGWGSGEQGQLGRRILTRHLKKGLTPAPLRLKRKRKLLKAVQVYAGGYGTMVVAKGAMNKRKGTSSSSSSDAEEEEAVVFACGLNNYGQCGRKPESEEDTQIEVPLEVESLNGNDVAQLGVSEHHSMALTADGRVFTVGRGDYGQLGQGDTNERHTFTQVKGFNNRPIRKIASGGSHCMALDDKGTVWTWGNGMSHQLASGDDDDETEPLPVSGNHLGARCVFEVAAGGQHSVILAELADK